MKQKETNIPHNPIHNSSFILHNCATVPVYYWRGARPGLIDLEAHQTGWLVCLSLTREGDSCLLPLAWQENSVLDNEEPTQTIPVVTVATKALDSTAVSLTLNDLQQVGWEINGRLTIQFTGRDAEPDFQQKTQSYLWQTPLHHS